MSDILGRLLGVGATSEVYEYDENRVVKLYNAGCSIDSVKWEYGKTLCACESNLPVPKIFGMIEYDNRYGIIMERIKGETLKDVIDKFVTRVTLEDIPIEVVAHEIFRYIKLTAHFLYRIHKIQTDKFETMNNRMKRDVKENSFLTSSEKDEVVEIIESLPTGDSVCHGDPNSNNIIVNGDTLVFIDWVNAGVGNPMYDIAEYVLLSTPSTSPIPKDTHPKLVEFYWEYKDHLIPTFLREYARISGLDATNHEKWFIPLLVSKLNSNRPIEAKMKILDDIRKRLTEKRESA